MRSRTPTLAWAIVAAAASLAMGGCSREERIPTPTAQSDTTPSTPSSDSQNAGSTAVGSTAPTTSTVGGGTSTAMSSGTTTGDGGAPGATSTSGTGSATGLASTAALAKADADFVTKAAEGGQFEVEVAKLAADKASSADVKTFAQMLVDDHSAANDKLRQIATSHNVALPASLPDAKKKELDQLGKLSGPAFDKQFVKMAGIKDHHHDIAEFEKASKNAQSQDVKQFAQSTLPTLKKHLEAAQKLPGAKG
jgi:putative membrane protein